MISTNLKQYKDIKPVDPEKIKPGAKYRFVFLDEEMEAYGIGPKAIREQFDHLQGQVVTTTCFCECCECRETRGDGFELEEVPDWYIPPHTLYDLGAQL